MADTFVWHPPEEMISESNISKLIQKYNFSNTTEFLRRTVEKNEWFWSILERELETQWDSKYSRVVEKELAYGSPPKWFVGGKFNISNQLLDYNLSRGLGNKKAILCQYENGENEACTYNMLYHSTSSLVKLLLEMGVKKGDRIGIISPLNTEAVTSLLALSRIGAIAVPVFSGFGKDAILNRFLETMISGFIAFYGYTHKGRLINNSELIYNISQHIRSLRFVITTGQAPRAESKNSDVTHVIWQPDYKNATSQYTRTSCEDVFEILYTSGTSGNPKGTIHTHIGTYLQPSKEVKFNFDAKRSDRIFWFSDLGWVMGTWSIISTFSVGATLMLMVGSPYYPNPRRFLNFIEENEITILGTSPTLIRMLKANANLETENREFASVRMIGSGGEPWDEPSYMWLFENIGKRKSPIINLSGGTEIMGSFLIPLPTIPIKSCSLQGPGLGMDVDCIDDTGASVRNKRGYLICRNFVPSMTKGLWKDKERFVETYWNRFPGIWFHGDFAMVDEDGHWYLLGRCDDLIKTSGKRIGPSEIEEIIIKIEGIKEAAAIGAPDPIHGEVVVFFVAAKDNLNEIENKIRNDISYKLGKSFIPKYVFFVEDLPKTNSGKISRDILRSIYKKEDITNKIQSISNPESLGLIRYAIQNYS